MSRGKQWLALATVLASTPGCGGDGGEPWLPPPTCELGLPALADGQCIRPGMGPDDCSPGFRHDGAYGCEPILPAEPCPPGLMAVPGDESCREVAPCAEGRWGGIPVEPSTEHVDGAYAGTDSDGSPERPWQRIQDGIKAAAPGAIVAVAAGSYQEDVKISGKAVRLWGRCPALVEIVGTGKAAGNLLVLGGAGGTEVRAIAVTAGSAGIVVSGVLAVALESVWVHDTGDIGIAAERTLGPTAAHVRGALIEHAARCGVKSTASEITLAASTVRDTTFHPSYGLGYGAAAAPGANHEPGKLTVTGSVLERNLGYGLAAADGELAIDASVIRDTQPGTNGWGVGIGCNANYGAASLSLRGSLIAGNVGMGVHLLAAAASIERSVLRDNQASALGGGFGVSAEPSATTGSPAGLAIDHSLIERNDGIGVHARNSDVVVDASVIRDTDPSTGTALQSLPGQGLEVVGEQPVGTPASLALSRSLVERSRQAGVVVMGATAAIESCLIRETRGDGGGAADGVVLIRTEDASTSATVLSTRIEESERAAITSYGGSLVAKQLRGVCNLVDIDGEGYSGSNYAVDDQGDNRCGCPEPSRACMVVTLGFQPAINP